MNRPELHFTPPAGWCNDPNGLVHDGERYHLFYQYYPHSVEGGPKHWGHAVSSDLMAWEHLPVALEPDEKGAIYSGSAVIADGGKMALMYTYHAGDGTESQAVAFSTDETYTAFEKYAGNPVIPNPGIKDFRDPKVFHRDSAGWHMALAAGDRVLFYKSPDLIAWERIGEFGAPAHPVGGLWECPDLFALRDADGVEKWALVFSLGLDAAIGGGKTMYFIGDYADGAFTPDNRLPLPVDNGQDFYAGVTFWGVPDNRRIMIAWMCNWAYTGRSPASLGWRGQMSLPRELTLLKASGGYKLSSVPIVKPERIKTFMAGDNEMILVADTCSIEIFAPSLGVSISQLLF